MRSAVLSSRHDAGGGLMRVALDVSAEAAKAYTTPGQYIQVHSDAGDGYFVLASEVAKTPWELLVKDSGGASDALATLPLGSTLAVDGPLGSGFPVPRMAGRHVVVAVVASALGVARAVLAQRIRAGAATSTHVFLGLRVPTDVPIADEVRDWTERGVRVVLCLSRSELHHHPEVLPKAARVVGYVQQALVRALETGEIPHGALVVAAGPEGMLADLRDLGRTAPELLPTGPRIEVLTNV